MKSPALLLTLAILFLADPARAQAPKHTIEVYGRGSVTAPSESLDLRVTVNTRGETVREAKERNDELTRDVFDRASRTREAAAQLVTTNAQLNFEVLERGPARNNEAPTKPNANAAPQIKGGKGQFSPFGPPEPTEPVFRMTRTVRIRFQRLPDAVELLSELGSWKSVTDSREVALSPLDFHAADPDKHWGEARKRAVKDATDKARLLAEAASLQLGVVTTIYDDAAEPRPAMGYRIAPTIDAPFDDPFSGPFGRADQPSLPSQFVAQARQDGGRRQQDRASFDADRTPPAQLTFAVTVRVVYSALPK